MPRRSRAQGVIIMMHASSIHPAACIVHGRAICRRLLVPRCALCCLACRRWVEEEAQQLALDQEVGKYAGTVPYAGAARGSGVNVNRIVLQLDHWCNLCDDVLLLPP